MFDGKTREIQHQFIRELLENEPWLVELLGEDWCNEHLLFEERKIIAEVHPFFFHLANPMTDGKVAKELKFFMSQESDRISRFAQRIKRETDKNNLQSLLDHLNAYCHLTEKGVLCDMEPPVSYIDDKGNSVEKECDLLVTLPDNREVFVEIISIFDSQKERERNEEIQKLRIAINAIPGNPYGISPDFKTPISNDDIGNLLPFIEEQIHSGTLPTKPDESEKRLYENNGGRVSVTFTYYDDAPGGWYSHKNCFYDDESAGRVKFKILSKLEEGKFQLPPLPALGGYLVFLDGAMIDTIDALDGLRGTPALAFMQDGNVRDVIKPDGVVDHEKGVRLKDVDFFVFVGGQMSRWNCENIVVSMNDQSSLRKDEIENIFF